MPWENSVYDIIMVVVFSIPFTASAQETIYLYFYMPHTFLTFIFRILLDFWEKFVRKLDYTKLISISFKSHLKALLYQLVPSFLCLHFIFTCIFCQQLYVEWRNFMLWEDRRRLQFDILCFALTFPQCF